MATMAKAIGFGLIALAGAQQVLQDPESACSSIANWKHPNVTVNFANHITAGTNISLTNDGNAETCVASRSSQVVPVDICRVAMYVATSNRSGITLEAWLPTNWTGRFLATGNGGMSGCIQYEDIAYGNSFGFAAVGANNGHNGTSGEAFYQNSDILEDFVYRSIYTETIVGKAITKDFYAQDYTKSYYLGCSTGGRQGFKLAQDFPEQFDGIVAGAPALAFNNLSSFSGRFYPITGSNTSESFLTAAKWSLVHQDVLKQCDTIDGVADGIIEDPDLCQYRPVALQCASNATNTSSCLTAAQVKTVSAVLADYYGENGSLIYPRLQPGAEHGAAAIYLNGQPFSYTEDWYRYAILEDPSWDAATLNSTYAAIAATKNPFNAETWKGDLSAFKNHGGKILHYHGLADMIITSDNSPRYYENVVTTMGQSPAELDSFYRFFRISGMGHCSGGVGAYQIGQDTGGARDAQHNVLQRMIDWVEKGDSAAPETLTGVKYVNDEPSRGVDFERRHCKWPLRNRCKDAGDYRNPDAWECVP